jgi:hypothetical protein
VSKKLKKLSLRFLKKVINKQEELSETERTKLVKYCLKYNILPPIDLQSTIKYYIDRIPDSKKNVKVNTSARLGRVIPSYKKRVSYLSQFLNQIGYKSESKELNITIPSEPDDYIRLFKYIIEIYFVDYKIKYFLDESKTKLDRYDVSILEHLTKFFRIHPRIIQDAEYRKKYKVPESFRNLLHYIQYLNLKGKEDNPKLGEKGAKYLLPFKHKKQKVVSDNYLLLSFIFFNMFIEHKDFYVPYTERFSLSLYEW